MKKTLAIVAASGLAVAAWLALRSRDALAPPGPEPMFREADLHITYKNEVPPFVTRSNLWGRPGDNTVSGTGFRDRSNDYEQAINWRLLGHSQRADLIRFTLNNPDGTVQEKREVRFSGDTLTIFDNEKVRVVVTPRKEGT
ncbi:MAG: hypothetical protein ACYSU0_10170 [Planctomycetota bacterium]|jgi:hypothetical protein